MKTMWIHENKDIVTCSNSSLIVFGSSCLWNHIMYLEWNLHDFCFRAFAAKYCAFVPWHTGNIITTTTVTKISHLPQQTERSHFWLPLLRCFYLCHVTGNLFQMSSWYLQTRTAIALTTLYYAAQHHPTGSETPPPYAPWSSRFRSELPSVEDDVNIWCYAILE